MATGRRVDGRGSLMGALATEVHQAQLEFSALLLVLEQSMLAEALVANLSATCNRLAERFTPPAQLSVSVSRAVTALSDALSIVAPVGEWEGSGHETAGPSPSEMTALVMAVLPSSQPVSSRAVTAASVSSVLSHLMSAKASLRRVRGPAVGVNEQVSADALCRWRNGPGKAAPFASLPCGQLLRKPADVLGELDRASGALRSVLDAAGVRLPQPAPNEGRGRHSVAGAWNRKVHDWLVATGAEADFENLLGDVLAFVEHVQLTLVDTGALSLCQLRGTWNEPTGSFGDETAADVLWSDVDASAKAVRDARRAWMGYVDGGLSTVVATEVLRNRLWVAMLDGLVDSVDTHVVPYVIRALVLASM